MKQQRYNPETLSERKKIEKSKKRKNPLYRRKQVTLTLLSCNRIVTSLRARWWSGAICSRPYLTRAFKSMLFNRAVSRVPGVPPRLQSFDLYQLLGELRDSLSLERDSPINVAYSRVSTYYTNGCPDSYILLRLQTNDL